MININNSVTNILGSPAFISDVIANIPNGKDVATGTIFVATDTGNMYQSDGNTWYSIGGGGGSTPGIDSVLAVNQPLINTRSIDLNTNVFQIVDNTQSFTDVLYCEYNDIRIGNDNSGSCLFVDANRIYTTSNINSVPSGIYFDYSTSVFYFGDINSDGNGCKFYIEDNAQIIRTYRNTQQIGISLNFANSVYKIGDEDYFLNIDSSQDIIQTYMNAQKYGLYLDWLQKVYTLGDYDANNNGSALNINDNNQTAYLYAKNDLQLQTDNLQIIGAVTATGSYSPGSNPHLVVKINGTTYYIQLLT